MVTERLASSMVLPGQVGRPRGIAVETGGWSVLPRDQSRRQSRDDFSCRTVTTLNQHMHPSQNMATRPNRTGPRRPRRLGMPRGPERPPAIPCQVPMPWGAQALIRKSRFVAQYRRKAGLTEIFA